MDLSTRIFILRHRLQANVVLVQFPSPFLFRFRFGLASIVSVSVEILEAVESSLPIKDAAPNILLLPIYLRPLKLALLIKGGTE